MSVGSTRRCTTRWTTSYGSACSRRRARLATFPKSSRMLAIMPTQSRSPRWASRSVSLSRQARRRAQLGLGLRSLPHVCRRRVARRLLARRPARPETSRVKFTIVSHACMYVEHGGTSVLVDPWIVGSCYWRSWWNFPEPDAELVESLRPDYIYLTHMHWDHFHGPSLRRFSRATRILIPKTISARFADDLRWNGFTDITEIDHGGRVELAPGLELSSYQFGHPSDSAVVISKRHDHVARCQRRQVLRRAARADTPAVSEDRFRVQESLERGADSVLHRGLPGPLRRGAVSRGLHRRVPRSGCTSVRATRFRSPATIVFFIATRFTSMTRR